MNHETNWIVKLIDGITKPARDIAKTVKDSVSSVDDLTEAVKFSEKDTGIALTKAKQYYKELEASITDVEKEMRELEKIKKSGSWNEVMKASAAFEKAEDKVNRLRRDLQGAEQDIKDLTKQAENFTEEAQNWAELFTGINQGLELADKAAGMLSFTHDIESLRVEIQRMTDLTGPALDELTEKAYKLGRMFEEAPDEIARAANAMTKQIGGTYAQNLDLIQAGFEKGANLNKDFLDQLKEYGPQLHELGLNGSQAIAIMAKAGKEGVFSDKAIDSIKEANLSLREMNQTQIDALAGIKLKPEDLMDKTPFEAVQLIVKQMQGASTSARQLIMADIFKGAGEDAGFKFVEGLASVDLDINNIPSVKQAGSGITEWLAELQASFSETFGTIGSYAYQIAPIVTGIASMIPIISMLSKVTWIQTVATKIATVAQWAWNIAMSANPIGLIIIAIAALVGAIVWVASAFTGWGELWKHTLEGAKLLFQAFVEGAKWYFNTLVDAIMIGLNYIKIGWYEFKNAVGIGDEDENNAILAKIHADTEARKDAIVDGAKRVKELGEKAADEFVLATRSLKRKPKDEKEEEAGSAGAYDFSTMGGDAPKLDGTTALTATGKEGGGSSGSRILNMTLNVTNAFNVKDGADFMARKDQIINEIVGRLNDSLKDSLIAAG